MMMKWIGMALLAAVGSPAAAAESARTVAEFRQFSTPAAGAQAPTGWSVWSPRPALAPRTWVDPAGGRSGGGALAVKLAGAEQFGAWRTLVEVQPGLTYRLSAWYRAEGVPYERRSISARLEWLDGAGKTARPPDYALDTRREGGWTRVEHLAAAPQNARRVRIELACGWAPGATVRWDDIRLEEVSAPTQRVVRALTVFHRPRGTKSAAESVEQFCRLVESASGPRPDVVCLPEGITVIGTGKSYAEVSEPVPGPTTERLGAMARKLNSYVVGGLYERVGEILYNTAVLIDRQGRLAGKYRKTHLPREEVEAGLTPGDHYPVFDTDFGRVGLMICWDLQFPEPCRAMALQGAEVILLPIWGGSEVLARARAIENHLFMITSSYDMKTFIVNPAGEVLAEATAQAPVAAAELHLDRKILQPWLGDMKPRTWKERRPDIPVEKKSR